MIPKIAFTPETNTVLHFGCARTLLFNWLLAKRLNGKLCTFFKPDALKSLSATSILTSQHWLDLQQDEGPYYHCHINECFERAVKKLIDRRFAYYDYSSQHEYRRERIRDIKSNRHFLYSRAYESDTEEQDSLFQSAGRKKVVRLRLPRVGINPNIDLIHSYSKYHWHNFSDIIIQDSDGNYSPILKEAVSYTNYDITHSISTEDRMRSMPYKTHIFLGLQKPQPYYGHLYVVSEPYGTKKLKLSGWKDYLNNAQFNSLNKQLHENFQVNPTLIDFYRILKFHPDAILSYLLFFDHPPKGIKRVMNLKQMVEGFSFNWAKTNRLNLCVWQIVRLNLAYKKLLGIKTEMF